MLLGILFLWTAAGLNAHRDIKEALTLPQVLMEPPMACDSRMMSMIEQRYTQRDKATLVIVWSVHKFLHFSMPIP